MTDLEALRALQKTFIIEENKRNERLRKFLQHNIHRTIKGSFDWEEYKNEYTIKAGHWKLLQTKDGCWYIKTPTFSSVLSELKEVCVVFE